VELAQVQVQATGDITSVALSFDAFVDGCDNDYVDEEGRPHFQ
jgi:hypothetical protein